MPTTPDSDSRVVDLLRAYLVADYRWERGGDWHDVVIGLPAPGLELAYPSTPCFGMLSAWNPRSIECDEHTNRAQDDALQADLTASGMAFLPAFASAPNRTWREPSWLVLGMPVADFDVLSQRYGQLGTLWWASGGSVRLRMDAAPPFSAASEAYVDWLK